MRAFRPLFALCLLCDVLSFVAINALGPTGGLGSSEAFLRFHGFAGILWALGILAASIIEGFCTLVPSPLFLLAFGFRALNIILLLYFDGVVAMSGLVFNQGLAFGSTLVQGILCLMYSGRGSTATWAFILPTCIIVGVFLPHVIICTIDESKESPRSTITMILNTIQTAGAAYMYGVGVSQQCFVPGFNPTRANGPLAEHAAESTKSHDELPTMQSPQGSAHGKSSISQATMDEWGVVVGFMQISCLVPILSEMTESQKASASTESWIFTFVVAIPIASFLFVKNDFDVFSLALWGNMLSNLTIIIFVWVDGSVCWSYLGFWLVICSTVAFYFDSVRETTEILALQPKLDCSCQLVEFLAGMATRVALGCLAGNVMRALIENFLPLPSGVDEIGFKACGAILPGAIFAVVIGSYACIFRRNNL